MQNNNDVIFDIEISTSSFFDDPKIFIHTPFGLPVVEPINNYSLDFQKLKTSFNFRLDQFNEKKFPIEIFFYDNNHSFKVEKNVEIENVDKNISTNNSLLYLLLISLLGGFILNLMPCVFPVLSLKLLSVINTEDKKIKSSFFITVLGIITSFFILGVFFALLKQINISISWGYAISRTILFNVHFNDYINVLLEHTRPFSNKFTEFFTFIKNFKFRK